MGHDSLIFSDEDRSRPHQAARGRALHVRAIGHQIPFFRELLPVGRWLGLSWELRSEFFFVGGPKI